MTEVTLIIGGNIGDLENSFRKARELIGRRVGSVITKSSVMESDPWGFDSDSNFLNQVLVVGTELEPQEFLTATQQIEQDLGRVHKTTNQLYTSRPIDIDILFYGNQVIDTPSLTVPHPLIEQREFVLEPLCEVAGQRVHPVTGKNMWQIYTELKMQKCYEEN